MINISHIGATIRKKESLLKRICTAKTAIKKAYTEIVENVAVLRLSSEDMQQLLGGKEYIMSVKLYDSQKRIQKTLIKKLQIFIQEVV